MSSSTITAEAITARDELTKRVIPWMEFSTGTSNPLTAPHPPDPKLSPAERAQQRFAIHGNAIVTGGAGNLGLAASRALLEHGAKGLCLFDMAGSLSSSKVAIESLIADHPDAAIIQKHVDVTDAELVQKSVDEVAAELGSVDILLCFAGVVGSYHAADITSAQWRKMLEINTTGTWFCAQAAGKQMIKQGKGGSIVLTASCSAHRVNYPQPQVGYNVSKAGLLQMKSSLAAEWARFGIRVNSVSPGYMDTILNEGDGLADFRKVWLAKNPTGRMGDPSEIAGIVILLCSGAGSYMTGGDYVVDGGFLVVL